MKSKKKKSLQIVELISEICNESMEKGRCNSNIIRVYFDKQTGQCRRFSYSGCDGNRNNFETEKYCNEICGDFQSKFHNLAFFYLSFYL